MLRPHRAWIVAGAIGLTACALVADLGSVTLDPKATGGDGSTSQPSGEGGSIDGCAGLRCQQQTCSTGRTTISGVVNAPNGKLPLSNALVYVPATDPTPFTEGVACERCAPISGDPIVQTRTTADGHFTLPDVPVGKDIPLIIQVGKWRRKATIPVVTACADTALDVERTRLPKNATEGDIPQMAVVTGGADTYQCFLLQLGVDPKEFTKDTGSGRVHVYSGRGGATEIVDAGRVADAGALWNSKPALAKYDTILLSCEAATYSEDKPGTAIALVSDYVSSGGHLFVNHHQRGWLTGFTNTAKFEDGAEIENAAATIDVSTPRRKAFSDWAAATGLSTSPGKVTLGTVKDTVVEIGGGVERWVYTDSPAATQLFAFDAPLDAGAQSCGRLVFADMHIRESDTKEPIPTGCTLGNGLNAKEKAVAYLLFDQVACQ